MKNKQFFDRHIRVLKLAQLENKKQNLKHDKGDDEIKNNLLMLMSK